MTAEQLVALPQPQPSHVYGAGDTRCELYLPAKRDGKPLPVIIAVHGGCWRARYDMGHLRPLCAALANEGYGVWSIEYRRVGNGGGWPTTFLDIGAQADRVRDVAAEHNLDLSRVIALGHSVGGQFVLWLGARAGFAPDHALYQPNPIKLKGIVAMAAIVDLADTFDLNICTGNAANLLGGMPREVPGRYAAASPTMLLPLNTPQHIICGRHDDTVPVSHTEPYARRAKAFGEAVTFTVIETIGHYEMAAPGTDAWPVVCDAVRQLAS
jgi:acetyl esterase/lipase